LANATTPFNTKHTNRKRRETFEEHEILSFIQNNVDADKGEIYKKAREIYRQDTSRKPLAQSWMRHFYKKYQSQLPCHARIIDSGIFCKNDASMKIEVSCLKSSIAEQIAEQLGTLLHLYATYIVLKEILHPFILQKETLLKRIHS